jgi:hypothetical protein
MVYDPLGAIDRKSYYRHYNKHMMAVCIKMNDDKYMKQGMIESRRYNSNRHEVLLTFPSDYEDHRANVVAMWLNVTDVLCAWNEEVIYEIIQNRKLEDSDWGLVGANHWMNGEIVIVSEVYEGDTTEVCLMKGEEGYFETMKTNCIHPLKLLSAPNGVTLKRNRTFKNEEGIMDDLNEPRKKIIKIPDIVVCLRPDMDRKNNDSKGKKIHRRLSRQIVTYDQDY